jgi:hypothetical protein
MDWSKQMLEVAKELLVILGGTGIAVAALAYVVKMLLTHWMDKSMESFKLRLAAEHDTQLDKLRNSLVQQAFEHEVRFRRNDEAIALHLNEVYNRILTLYESVCNYVKILEWSTDPPKEDRLEVVNQANKDFWKYFLQNRLYIPKPLYQRTRALADKLIDITNKFTENQRREEKGLETDDRYWSKAFTEVNQESGELFSALVDEFQVRIGLIDGIKDV